VKITSCKVAPSSQDQRKQPLVDRCLSAINPDTSQPSGALSNPVVKTTISPFVYSISHTTNTNSIPSVLNSSFVRAVAVSLPNSGHPLPSMGMFCSANIPCPSRKLLQLKLNLLLNPCQLQLRHRISKNIEALNTALLLFYPPRIRRHLWLIECPAQSTRVRTFRYPRYRSWSVMCFVFPFQTRPQYQQGTDFPPLCCTLSCPLIRPVIPLLVLLQILPELGLGDFQ
jgi:hypothetical protein